MGTGQRTRHRFLLFKPQSHLKLDRPPARTRYPLSRVAPERYRSARDAIELTPQNPASSLTLRPGPPLPCSTGPRPPWYSGSVDSEPGQLWKLGARSAGSTLVTRNAGIRYRVENGAWSAGPCPNRHGSTQHAMLAFCIGAGCAEARTSWPAAKRVSRAAGDRIVGQVIAGWVNSGKWVPGPRVWRLYLQERT